MPRAAILILLLLAPLAHASDFEVGGYLQAMPLALRTQVPGGEGRETLTDYRAQSRLNLRWYASEAVNITWEMRTRVFAGDLVEQFPGYAESIDNDSGRLNLSTFLAEEDDWLAHYETDRLYAEWRREDWTLRAGRQRINWGVNTVTNPNDLFNTYSIYAFDYPERPGTDALRLQRHTGFASRWELAVSPGESSRDTVAAGLYAFNTQGYDIQLLAGYYREKLALGGGWAGSIGQSGFKGEVTGFVPPGDDPEHNRPHLVAAVSADHMFDNSVFLVVEGLYNQRGGRGEMTLRAEGLSPDNPSPSRWQLTTQASYPVNPLLNTSLAAIWYPDEQAVFLAPSLTFSATRNSDLRLLAQVFAGSDDSALSDAGDLLAASWQWNF